MQRKVANPCIRWFPILVCLQKNRVNYKILNHAYFYFVVENKEHQNLKRATSNLQMMTFHTKTPVMLWPGKQFDVINHFENGPP